MIIDGIKNEAGISIIALTVTIILLLIIAGASISTMSNDAILQKAEVAVSAYTEKSVREKVELKIASLNIDKIDTDLGKATLEDVLNMKDSDSEITDTYQSGDNVVVILNNKYKCEVNESLEVESVEHYVAENQGQLFKLKRRVTVDTIDMFERQEVNENI